MPRTLTTRLMAVLAIVALVASLFIAIERIQVENQDKKVEIAATMEDVASFAAAKNLDFESMCREMKKHGLTNVLFKEISVGDVVRKGDAEMAFGRGVYQLTAAHLLPTDMPVDDAHLYLLVHDEATDARLLKHLTKKWAGVERYEGAVPVYAISAMIPVSQDEMVSATKDLMDIGLGFDEKRMAAAEAADVGQMVQIRSFPEMTEAAQKALKSSIQEVPHLSLILFNDKVIPLYPDAKLLSYMLQKENGRLKAPLGSIEFTDQLGFSKLALVNDKNVLRLHTISNEEMSKFEGDTKEDQTVGETEALARWELAVTERNIRVLLVRFFNIDQPAASFDDNMQYLENIQQRLLDHDFKLEKKGDVLPSLPGSFVLYLLAALGGVSGSFFMLRALGFKDFWAVLLAGVLLGGYLIGYLAIDAVLARKVMALVSVIVWPTFSAITFLDTRPQSLGASIVRLLLMSAFSFLGAVFMVGLLSDAAFMLKLEYFSGVKLAHIIPLLLVPLSLYVFQETSPWQGIKALAEKAVDYRWLVLMTVAALILVIYVVRTGNADMEISNAESGMRQWLKDIFGVRPRSKEFLFGYPLTLLYFYFVGKKPNYWPLAVAVVIGQVSLVNTYAHLHTPLLISLLRSGLGLLLGIIIGSLLILVIEFLAGIVAKGKRKGQVG